MGEATNKKKNIAVFANGWCPDYIANTIDGINSACSEDHVNLFIFLNHSSSGSPESENRTETNFFKYPNLSDYDGVILLTNTFSNSEEREYLTDAIKATKVPAVSFSFKIDGIPYIGTDNYAGMSALIEHLILERHVQNPIYVSGPEHHQEAQSRLKAFTDVCLKHKLNITDENIVYGDWGDYSTYLIIKNLLAHGKQFDSVICANDDTAAGAAKAILEAGLRIPEDVMLTGYDGTSMGLCMDPPLTSVIPDFKAMGRAGMNVLLAQLNNEPYQEETVFPSQIVLRASCGCEYNPSEEERLQTLHSSYVFQRNTMLETDMNFRNLYRAIRYIDTIEALNNALYYNHRKEIAAGQTCLGIFMNHNFIENVEATNDENLDLVFGFIKGKVIPRQSINVIKKLRSHFQEVDANISIVLVPLHTGGGRLGIATFDWHTDLVKDYYLYTWTRHFGQDIDLFQHNVRIKQLNDRLKTLSRTDALTGVYNRVGCETISPLLVSSAELQGRNCAIIIADVDNMKLINDNYGHQSGDKAIKTLAKVIKATFPDGFAISRYGGDEFTVVGLCDSREDIDNYIDLLQRKLLEQARADKLEFLLTTSVGGYLKTPQDSKSFTDCINEADKALYEMKRLHHATRSL